MVESAGQEQNWIEQSQVGDEGAFENLIRMHQRMIHGVTFRMSGSADDADDLAQETFVQAFRQISSFRGESKFSSWLCRVAINTCLSWRRSESRRKERQRIWAEESQVPDATGINDETSQRIYAALNQLTPQQRAAVTLTIYEGMNHAEAAKALGCAETTISWRLFTARRKLKQLLRAEINKEPSNAE